VRERRPLPSKIENAPALLPGLDLFFGAFSALGCCRSIGFGDGEIPWTAISEYCDRNGIDGDQRTDTFFFIRELDHEYLMYKAEKAKEDQK
jgi:hypothetical protein